MFTNHNGLVFLKTVVYFENIIFVQNRTFLDNVSQCIQKRYNVSFLSKMSKFWTTFFFTRKKSYGNKFCHVLYKIAA